MAVPGFDLFFYIVIFILSIFMVLYFEAATRKYADKRIKKFIQWIMGASLAYMFGAFLQLLNLLSPGIVFGEFQPVLIGFTILAATVYMLRAAMLLSKIGDES